MANYLKDKIKGFLLRNGLITEDSFLEINTGIEKLEHIINDMDKSILNLKISTLNNSAHLMMDRVMKDNNYGVIEILDNTKDVVNFYEYIENFDTLLKNYLKYKMFFDEDYPEIKEIKFSMALKDKELIEILKEIANDYNVVI